MPYTPGQIWRAPSDTRIIETVTCNADGELVVGYVGGTAHLSKSACAHTSSPCAHPIRTPPASWPP